MVALLSNHGGEHKKELSSLVFINLSVELSSHKIFLSFTSFFFMELTINTQFDTFALGQVHSFRDLTVRYRKKNLKFFKKKQ